MTDRRLQSRGDGWGARRQAAGQRGVVAWERLRRTVRVGLDGGRQRNDRFDGYLADVDRRRGNGDKYRQVRGPIVIGRFELRALVRMPKGYVTREMTVDRMRCVMRGRVIVIVLMDERRDQGGNLDRRDQTGRDDAAEHASLLVRLPTASS
jgi:hypothetical protein